MARRPPLRFGLPRGKCDECTEEPAEIEHVEHRHHWCPRSKEPLNAELHALAVCKATLIGRITRRYFGASNDGKPVRHGSSITTGYVTPETRAGIRRSHLWPRPSNANLSERMHTTAITTVATTIVVIIAACPVTRAATATVSVPAMANEPSSLLPCMGFAVVKVCDCG